MKAYVKKGRIFVKNSHYRHYDIVPHHIESIACFRKSGYIQGYRVIIDGKHEYFKHYTYRQVAEDSAFGDFLLYHKEPK